MLNETMTRDELRLALLCQGLRQVDTLMNTLPADHKQGLAPIIKTIALLQQVEVPNAK